jgi:FAD/FMN-containing dehydrogenase
MSSAYSPPGMTARQSDTSRGPAHVGSSGVYVNFLGHEGEESVRAAYGVNYERLVALKNKYDPTNLFHLNQNIPPVSR